jgi:Peptidase S46
MKKIYLIAAVVTAGLVLVPRAEADEGMYLLHEAGRLDLGALRKRGLKLSVKQLQDLAPAIVQMNRGGTGSFLSAQGLIVTNHHVAYGCLARLDATSHKGIMKRGHVARSRQTEVACPSYDLLAVLEVKDVTAEVLKVVRPPMTPEKRAKAIRIQKRRLEAACQKRGQKKGQKRGQKKSGRVCDVDALNGGAGYVMSAYKRIKDVRIVYAPPKSLGKFGGDVDNWRYPRHTADFTFMRAYVSPGGEGVSYNKANVPYKPRAFLKVATSGVRRGQFNMVLGFPGRTNRHATHARAKYYSDRVLARRVKLFGELLKVLPKKGLDGRRYQGMDSRLNNGLKYYSDSIKQFARFGLLARKKKQQAAWQRRIDASPTLKKKHAKLLGRFDTVFHRLGQIQDKLTMLRYMPYLVSSLRTAVDLVRWSGQRRIKDVAREGERYRDKNIYRVMRSSGSLESRTTVVGEKALLLRFLRYAKALPKNQQLDSVQWLWKWASTRLRRLQKRKKRDFAKRYAKATRGAKPQTDVLAVAVDLLYGATRIYAYDVTDKKAVSKAVARRKKLFKASARKIKRTRDPLLRFAVRLVRELKKMKKGSLRTYEKVLAPILRPQLVSQVIRPKYWDANFTVRLSYGTVKDYTESKTGKRWRYLSRLTWLVKKGKGKFPFYVPPKLKAVYKKKDFGRWKDPVIQDVPVNFTTTLDTTGGNSGSPVLNGKGELIGLLFDGTPESILSDWQYLETAQRSICVDIRFALFLADKVDNAKYVLKELGL